VKSIYSPAIFMKGWRQPQQYYSGHYEHIRRTPGDPGHAAVAILDYPWGRALEWSGAVLRVEWRGLSGVHARAWVPLTDGEYSAGVMCLSWIEWWRLRRSPPVARVVTV
jgi:hypothetical protein